MSKMKKIIAMVLLSLGLVLIAACSSSPAKLEGKWKVQTGDKKNGELVFTKDTVTVDGEKYPYKQKSIERKEGIVYYKIEQDGESYSVIFPDPNKNIAIMIQPTSKDNDLSGLLLYAMNKKRETKLRRVCQEILEIDLGEKINI